MIDPQYLAWADEASKEHGVPPQLLHRLIGAESSWNPSAVSSKGAVGIAQFMPGTARRFGIDPTNPQQSIGAAAKYLRANYDQFGSWSKAAAGYNWGEGNVMKTPNQGQWPSSVQSYVNQVGARQFDRGTGLSVPEQDPLQANRHMNQPKQFRSLMDMLKTDKPMPEIVKGARSVDSMLEAAKGESDNLEGAGTPVPGSTQMPKPPSNYEPMDFSGFLNAGYTEGRASGEPSDSSAELSRLIGMLANLQAVGGQRSRKRVN